VLVVVAAVALSGPVRNEAAAKSRIGATCLSGP
jgi:hypothetical protein